MATLGLGCSALFDVDRLRRGAEGAEGGVPHDAGSLDTGVGEDAAGPTDGSIGPSLDGSALDAGCELRTFWRDADGDGYGDPAMPIEACEPPDGYVDDDRDCDDDDPDVHPGASELCNGRDDNCNGAVDEAFECPMGSDRACTRSSPSGSVCSGTQTCSETCTWSMCELPPESCNREDDDCDDRVDEGILMAGASGTTLNGATTAARAAWDPVNRRLAIAYLASSRPHVQIVDENGISISGVASSTDTAIDVDVAFDGTRFILVWVRAGSPRVVRGGLYTPPATTLAGVRTINTSFGGTDGPARVRSARFSETNQVGVVFTLPASTSMGDDWIVGYRLSASESFIDVAVGETTIVRESADITFPAITSATPDHAALAYTVNTRGGTPGNSPLSEIRYRTWRRNAALTPVVVLTSTPHQTWSELELAFDPDEEHIGGVAVRHSSGGTRETRLLVHEFLGASVGSAVVGANHISGAFIATAGEQAFGVLFSPSSGAPGFVRYRSRDAAVYPDPISVSAGRFLVGVPEGSGRYFGLQGGTTATARPVAAFPIRCD